MLENSEKGYHMVKKACTMMHSLIDNWKPPPRHFPLWKTVEYCYSGAYIHTGI